MQSEGVSWTTAAVSRVREGEEGDGEGALKRKERRKKEASAKMCSGED